MQQSRSSGNKNNAKEKERTERRSAPSLKNMHNFKFVLTSMAILDPRAFDTQVAKSFTKGRAVLEIKKKSRLSLFRKPGNQTREFGCPDESLVAR